MWGSGLWGAMRGAFETRMGAIEERLSDIGTGPGGAAGIGAGVA